MTRWQLGLKLKNSLWRRSAILCRFLNLVKNFLITFFIGLNIQEECIREESRYHSLQTTIAMARIKLERADKEKQWRSGSGRMMRDFASFKELYAVSVAAV